MLSRVLLGDTIAAVITPRGRGGISVIRVSGPKCLGICRQLCSFLPEHPETHKIFLGILRRAGGEPLDQVLVSFFSDGKSFTGEQTIEISCHGNPIISSEIISELIFAGARVAERGEFSYRAFMNGKIDLVQAESILTLIEADSRRAAGLALTQLNGNLSERLLEVESDLIHLLANFEASIDFSTEDIQPFARSDIQLELDGILKKLRELLSSYKRGKLFNEGLRVALVGKPNVGKSSLLNLFLEKDRAIVSDEAGTTRDVVDGSFTYEGVKFEFFDTAGIRSSSPSEIEKMGIKRSILAANEAQVIFFVFDSSTGLDSDDLLAWKSVVVQPHQSIYFLANKMDLITHREEKNLNENCFDLLKSSIGNSIDETMVVPEHCFRVSALNQMDRVKVLDTLVSDFGLMEDQESAVVSNARHFDLLLEAHKKVSSVESEFNSGMGEEFLTLGLRDALQNILAVLGKHYDDQILDKIFKEFCLGK